MMETRANDSIFFTDHRLKPCPFCGNTEVYQTYRQPWMDACKEPIICCDSCNMSFSVDDHGHFTKLDMEYEYRVRNTIEKWNRRQS